ncbi:MAG TPA: N-acetylmuramoyl-L-alanine amidase, partial [Candidatus Wallbacteria bacterium]|nr:N-acetylmuramoyl-L-alanine amidase [Candidatus Wallbacteria bacterium]
AGFIEFCKIVQKYDISSSKIKKVRINTHLTRRHSWEDDPEKNSPNVNKKYRLFDSPDSFSGGAKGKPSEKLYPGRISFINQLSPDLVVCLHNNSSPNRNVRGFSSVIVPHFDFFSNINGIITNGIGNVAPNDVKVNEPKYKKVASFITSVITRHEKIDVKTIISDTATYFTGFRAFTQKFIGLRYLMVTWRYNTSSLFTSFMLFFMRENSIYENYRRSGGPEGYGGDNFYSSEEIIRFIRAALWNDLKSSNASYAARTNPEEYAGEHASPFVSDWAIPLHVNAITSFIEIGYLSNAKDRKMLKEKQAVIAESIAVGIYSLLAGLKPVKLEGIESPRGAAIDFAKYGRDKNSNGYFNISCRPLAF